MPNVGDISTAQAFDRIQSTGPLNIVTGEIWQSANGFLGLAYNQKSLSLNNNRIDLPSGDSSNNRLGEESVNASISVAMALNTSGLSSTFEQQAGSLSQQTPGLIDFSFLIGNNKTKAQVLTGYAYSNESSSFANDFSYYECLDRTGVIKMSDQLTGRIIHLRPGDDGYNDAAWASAHGFTGSGGAAMIGERQSADRTVLTPFEVNLSRLTSGYLVPVVYTEETGQIWTPFASANNDHSQHFLSTGLLSWRVEDQYGLGDRDFNDLHVSLLIASIS